MPADEMKKKYSRLAITSSVLGFTGLCLDPRRGWLILPGLLLGVTAISFGGAALLSIRKRQGLLRGRGLAISGTCLGVWTVLLSALAFVGMFFNSFNSGRQQQDRAGRLQRALAVHQMPKESVTNFTSNLPIIILHTDGEPISKDSDTVAHAEFFDVRDQRASTSAKPDYDGLVAIHRRGSSSLKLPKQSFTLHTVDSKTNQVKVSLLGLPKEEDWVLYAPFEDKTMMRDVLAFQLANQMGRYAPRTRYVELFLKTSSDKLSMGDYEGVYVLMEKIKRGRERVNIQKLEPQHRSEPEITGGYIVKRDHHERREPRFHTEQGGPYFYVSPNAQTITSQQKAWLTRYFNSFENALYSDDFADPKRGYAGFLDVDSFIDAHWLVEASKNVDGFRYSSFITKDRGGKLKPEPPWDFNRSFGNANYYGAWQTHGWYWSNLRPNEISWHLRLREDPAYVERCAARWVELRKTVFDPKKIHASIDEMAAQLEEAQARNYKRWPVLGRPVTANHYVGESFEDEVRWLKKWIERRITWIDSQVGTPSNL